MNACVGVQGAQLLQMATSSRGGKSAAQQWWSCELRALLARFGSACTRYETRPAGGAILEIDLSLPHDCPRGVVAIVAHIPPGYPCTRPLLMPLDRRGTLSRECLRQVGRCISGALAAAGGGPSVLFAVDRAVAMLRELHGLVPLRANLTPRAEPAKAGVMQENGAAPVIALSQELLVGATGTGPVRHDCGAAPAAKGAPIGGWTGPLCTGTLACTRAEACDGQSGRSVSDTCPTTAACRSLNASTASEFSASNSDSDSSSDSSLSDSSTDADGSELLDDMQNVASAAQRKHPQAVACAEGAGAERRSGPPSHSEHIAKLAVEAVAKPGIASDGEACSNRERMTGVGVHKCPAIGARGLTPGLASVVISSPRAPSAR
eukprot:CAMPEP_0179132088 /NCGR_PEP_ID=MMETSP0796-20121207/62768_1 /TAXON_ID=73915 /ORGANISM="Pyrodinium bahamense, Strain pbaha01" /LENGTH=376 /DNA_ID=CAMNT_0020831025 /DNA_START=27 /DNA_END=1152 /DNA_ORIENTATION=+